MDTLCVLTWRLDMEELNVLYVRLLCNYKSVTPLTRIHFTSPFVRWVHCTKRTTRELHDGPRGLALLQYLFKSPHQNFPHNASTVLCRCRCARHSLVSSSLSSHFVVCHRVSPPEKSRKSARRSSARSHRMISTGLHVADIRVSVTGRPLLHSELRSLVIFSPREHALGPPVTRPPATSQDTP